MTQELIERLEPCPFCGESDGEETALYVTWDTRQGRTVLCNACGSQGPSCPGPNETEAISAWNTRDQSQSARIAELRSDFEHPAVVSSAKFLRGRYRQAKCDSEAVSDCVNCNTMFLIGVIDRALISLSPRTQPVDKLIDEKCAICGKLKTQHNMGSGYAMCQIYPLFESERAMLERLSRSQSTPDILRSDD